MDLDNLKNNWKVNSRIVGIPDASAEAMAKRAAAGRAASAQRRFARAVRINASFGMALPIIAPIMYIIFRLPMWICVCYGLFGVVASVANFMLASFVMTCDLVTEPVVTALAHVTRIRKYRLRIVSLMLTISFLLIIGLFWEFYKAGIMNGEILIGFVAGLVIGSAFGIFKFHRQSVYINRIEKSLKDAI